MGSRPFHGFLLILIYKLVQVVSAASGSCDVPPLVLPWSNVTVSTNGLAVTRGIELGIGTPNQIFGLRPSTTLNNTRLVNVLDCVSETNTSCVGGKGGVYDSSKSSTFLAVIKDRWNGSTFDTETSTGSYVYFTDVIDFQANSTVPGFPLVEDSDVVSGKSFENFRLAKAYCRSCDIQHAARKPRKLGVHLLLICCTSGGQAGLPLGKDSSFLAAVTKAKVAPSEAWGLWAGDRSLDPVDGELVIGGYDKARTIGNFSTFPLGDWSQSRPCPLQVTVKSVTYVDPYYGSYAILNDTTDEVMAACVEPFQERFTFTPDMASNFAYITDYNGTDEDFTYPIDDAPLGNLTITLDNGYTTTIPNEKFVTLLRGSDKNGRYVVTNSSVAEAGIAYNIDDDDDDVQPLLGGLFLSMNYLVVDYEKNQFQMAPAIQGVQPDSSRDLETLCTPTATPSPPPTATPTPLSGSLSGSGGGVNRGAIAGGVVGGVAGLAIVGAIVFFLFRRRRQQRRQPIQQPPAYNSTQDDKTPAWLSTNPVPSRCDPQSPSELPQSPTELPTVRIHEYSIGNFNAFESNFQ